MWYAGNGCPAHGGWLGSQSSTVEILLLLLLLLLPAGRGVRRGDTRPVRGLLPTASCSDFEQPSRLTVHGKYSYGLQHGIVVPSRTECGGGETRREKERESVCVRVRERVRKSDMGRRMRHEEEDANGVVSGVGLTHDQTNRTHPYLMMITIHERSSEQI